MSKPVTLEQATGAARRLIANAFGGREAKLCIPAQEDDDDLLLSRYLQQQAATATTKDQRRAVAEIHEILREAGVESLDTTAVMADLREEGCVDCSAEPLNPRYITENGRCLHCGRQVEARA